jgi:C1A family cysteine protease
VTTARALGWSPPSLEQQIRHLCKAHPLSSVKLPAAAPTSDNSALCCDLDQGQLGSCTANGAAQVLYMELVREGLPAFIASRLAVYYWNRNRDGNALEDTGASVGGSFEVVSDMGVPEEAVWPYDVARFAVAPTPDVDRNAYDRKGSVDVNYIPVRLYGDELIATLERVLTSGRGVAFGITVSEKFCGTWPDGIIQPLKPSDTPAGGHCMSLIGHNHAEQWFLVKNSWAPTWSEPGQPPGCCRFSYDAIKQGSDFWFVSLSTGGAS